MSKIDFCPRGGMNGIRTSDEELNTLSTHLRNEYLDMYIPLPKISLETQGKLIRDCKDHSLSPQYWERDNGSHGWCCGECGTVIQWG